MRKLLKILGILAATLVLLIIVAALVLPLIIDPNDFKPRIEAAVEEATGRELEIPGDIKLSVFPWLGAELGAVRLGEAPEFGDEPFATIEGVQVRVKLLPLLSREVEVGKIVVERPRIRLLRDEQGRGNWEDLAGEPQEESEAPAEEQQELPDFSVDGIEIREAYIYYRDMAAAQELEVSGFNMTTGHVSLPADFPFTASGHVRMVSEDLEGNFELSSRISADLETERFNARDGRLQVTARGEMLPMSDASLRAEWVVAGADMREGKAALEDFVLSSMGVNLELNAEVSQLAEAPAVVGQLEFTAADLAQTAEELRALLPEDMTLSGKARGNARFAYEQENARAEVSEFSMRVLGLDVNGWMQAEQLDTDPVIKGRIETGEFSPGQLMVRLGQELPATRDGEVLDSARLGVDIDATPNSAVLDNLLLELDESTLRGRVEIADLERQALRFDLSMDAIDVDRYLPPADETAAEQAGAETPLNEIELPVELVRGLDIEGRLAIGELKAFNFNSTEVRIGVTARNDNLRIHPAEARFYGGGYNGDIRINAGADLPVISVNENLERIQLEPLMKDVLDSEQLSGTAQFAIQAEARGHTIGDLRQTLSGNFEFDVSDGTIEGFNLWESIREAYATVRGRSYDRGDAPDHTEFADLSASGRMEGGVIHNENLLASLPFLRVNGEGTIDIAEETLDYVIRARVMRGPELEGGIQELGDTEIPVRISGPLTDPRVRPDVKAVLEQKAREELERKEEEVRDKAEEKIEEEKERAKERVKDKLKDFFG